MSDLFKCHFSSFFIVYHNVISSIEIGSINHLNFTRFLYSSIYDTTIGDISLKSIDFDPYFSEILCTKFTVCQSKGLFTTYEKVELSIWE